MNRFWVVWMLVLLVLVASACAPGANLQVGTPGADGEIAGFWLGLWHGFIVPVTFIVSLFSDNVAIYEVHNTGGWYDFAFLIGVSSSIGGGAAGSAGRSRRVRSD